VPDGVHYLNTYRSLKSGFHFFHNCVNIAFESIATYIRFVIMASFECLMFIVPPAHEDSSKDYNPFQGGTPVGILQVRPVLIPE